MISNLRWWTNAIIFCRQILICACETCVCVCVQTGRRSHILHVCYLVCKHCILFLAIDNWLSNCFFSFQDFSWALRAFILTDQLKYLTGSRGEREREREGGAMNRTHSCCSLTCSDAVLVLMSSDLQRHRRQQQLCRRFLHCCCWINVCTF